MSEVKAGCSASAQAAEHGRHQQLQVGGSRIHSEEDAGETGPGCMQGSAAVVFACSVHLYVSGIVLLEHFGHSSPVVCCCNTVHFPTVG